MIRLDPSGHAQSFSMPLLGSKADQRAAIRSHLMGIKPEAAPAASPAAAATGQSEADFDSLLADLETSIGSDALAKILSADDRAAARADEQVRAKFIFNVGQWRDHYGRKQAVEVVEASKIDAQAVDKQRDRLRALGRVVADAEQAARGGK
jgi:hypothetical protein